MLGRCHGSKIGIESEKSDVEIEWKRECTAFGSEHRFNRRLILLQLAESYARTAVQMDGFDRPMSASVDFSQSYGGRLLI